MLSVVRGRRPQMLNRRFSRVIATTVDGWRGKLFGRPADSEKVARQPSQGCGCICGCVWEQVEVALSFFVGFYTAEMCYCDSFTDVACRNLLSPAGFWSAQREGGERRERERERERERGSGREEGRRAGREGGRKGGREERE